MFYFGQEILLSLMHTEHLTQAIQRFYEVFFLSQMSQHLKSVIFLLIFILKGKHMLIEFLSKCQCEPASVSFQLWSLVDEGKEIVLLYSNNTASCF